jgi:ABC-type sugar transport system ATPase subunit
VLLRAKNLKVFDSRRVYFDELNFDVAVGDRIQVMAGAGFGTSLLMKILAGFSEGVQTQGSLEWEGRNLLEMSSRDLAREGVLYLRPQNSSFPSLTNLEHLQLSFPKCRPSDWSAIEKQLGLHLPSNQKAERNSDRQNIWRSLFPVFLKNWRLLLIDHNFSRMSFQDQRNFFSSLSKLGTKGAVILPLTAGEFPDFRPTKIWSLRSTKIKITPVSAEDETLSVRLKSLESNKEARYPQKNLQSKKAELFRIESTSDSQRKLSFFAGEIFGLFSKGSNELARAILDPELKTFSQLKVKMIWEEKSIAEYSSLQKRLQLGISYVSGFRSSMGVFPSQSARFNLCFPWEYRNSSFWIRDREESEVYAHFSQVLRIPRSVENQPLQKLSPDIRQKVLLGRALSLRPRLLIADEITRGMGIEAQEEVSFALRDLADFGVSILWVSQDPKENEKICHRVAVLSEEWARVEILEGPELSAKNMMEGAQRVYGRS